MSIVHGRFANGLTWGHAPVPGALHAHLIVQWPMGVVADPPHAQGAALVLHEWLQRGAGGRDSRAFAEAFAALGVRRGGAVGREKARLDFSFLVADAAEVTALAADLVRAPALRDADFDASRRLVLEGRAAAADDPASLLDEAVVAARYRAPWSRPALGRATHVRRLDPAALRESVFGHLTPVGAFVCVAGGGGAALWRTLLAEAFAAWPAPAATPVPPAPRLRPPGVHHRRVATAQTHVALLDSADPPGSPRFVLQAIAMTALAGGTASPLWHEVRERRALAYDVSSTVRSLGGDAFRVTTAATRPERAAATLSALERVLTRERRVRKADLERFAAARDQLRTNLRLDQEGVGGHAARLLHDLRHHGRPRTLEERLAAVAAATPSDVADFVGSRGPLVLTRVTLGEAPVGTA